jgi:hypothetical protein
MTVTLYATTSRQITRYTAAGTTLCNMVTARLVYRSHTSLLIELGLFGSCMYDIHLFFSEGEASWLDKYV